MPMVSAMQAMVLAVPITGQVPSVVQRRAPIASIWLRSQPPASELCPEAAAVGAGAEALLAVAGGHHRAGDQQDGRLVCGDGAHEKGGHGLVAAADQDDGVHRLGADHLLDVHAHQVAEHQRGRRDEAFAERDGGKGDRQAACREHAALGRLDQPLARRDGSC